MALTFSPGALAGLAHVAFVIEDDPVMAKMLCDFASSIGHEWMHAVTLEDARKGIERGGYCYVLLDMQIPSAAGSIALVGCGETALRLLRAKEPLRNARGKHTLQIIVVTSYSREPEFVTRLLKMDADDFVPKPIVSQQTVPDKVLAALADAGRDEHASCAAGPAAAKATEDQGLFLEGSRAKRRTAVLVHGERRYLQDRRFVALVRLAVAHAEGPHAWVLRSSIGLEHAPETASRLCADLRGLLPKGERVVETDGDGRLRLNPKVVVRGDWEALVRHPEVAVQRIARERRERA
jgi:CheY-like chemotaxis protein